MKLQITGAQISPYTEQEENKLQRQKILMFISPIYKSGGLHEKHVVATWKLGNLLSIRL